MTDRGLKDSDSNGDVVTFQDVGISATLHSLFPSCCRSLKCSLDAEKKFLGPV